MKNIEIFLVVAGKRFAGGKVLKVLTSATAYKCGGPATAAIKEWERLTRKGVVCHAKRYHADLHGPIVMAAE